MTESSHDNNVPATSNGSNGSHSEVDNFRQPELVPSQLGNRWVSLAALVEQIESAFIEDFGQNSPELAEADTPAKRLKLVLETANYVISVESVQLSPTEKADVISRTYSSLFGYGPLDALFADDTITTISLEDADKASIRRGNGDLVSIGPIFQNSEHYQRIVSRLVADAGAEHVLVVDRINRVERWKVHRVVPRRLPGFVVMFDLR